VQAARTINIVAVVTEKMLAYDRSVVPQERFWDCGPAAAQVVCNGRGVIVSEDTLIREMGTDQDGTDYVGLVEQSLNRHLGGQYTSVYITDPASRAAKDALLVNVANSINAGFGCVFNFVSPPSNRPKGVKGSVSPNYGYNTVFHYVACMGVDVEEKAVWIADSGFQPQGYWISADQAASLIAPKGYTYSTIKTTAPTPVTPSKPTPAGNLWASRSPYRDNNDAFMTVDDALFNIDAMAHAGLLVEPAALRGELWAVDKIATLAAGRGPGAYLWWDATKRDDWAIGKAQAILNLIERTNPDALKQYLDLKGRS
jgi:Peptidase_C39 like family